MIDLRSDTLTRPTPGMRAAMAAAEVGDDVYGEDPSIARLEAQIAEMLGKEAGLFCVTGSLSNILGVWTGVEPGVDVLCDADAHIVRAELGAHALLHGVTTRTFGSVAGRATAAAIESMIIPDLGPFLVRTGLIEIEDTHNFAGGTVQDLAELRAIRALADRHGLRMHLDGARLWNAAVATGIEPAEVAALFDTVSVCFSKGLGAPVGSMLLGSRDDIARARLQRKRLGAGWRQAGILAEAARYAVDHQRARLADDHAAAQALAAEIASRTDGVVGDVPTNIVVAHVAPGTAPAVVAKAADRGVAVSAMGASVVRACTHLDVTLDEARTAGVVLGEIIAG